MKLNIPCRGNKKLEKVVDRIRASKRLHTMWKCSNVNAIERKGYSDHGPVHVAIVANAALQMLRLLVDAGVAPSVVRDHDMEVEDAEVVVVLGAVLHDIGMSVHRNNHELFSMILAPHILPELLVDYPIEQQIIMQSEIMHALPHYSTELKPYTIEAGIIRVADALDMSKGRSRIPFEAGEVNIHSVSAQAIDDVKIIRGEKKPVRISVTLNNSAGIFQLDELLRPRVEASGLKDYLEIEATVKGKEKQIVRKVVL